jgi:hypothetical protein
MKNRDMRRIIVFAGVALAGLALGSLVAPAHAGAVSFVTPTGATTSGGGGGCIR